MTDSDIVNYCGLQLTAKRFAWLEEGVKHTSANNLSHFILNVQYGKEGQNSRSYELACKQAHMLAQIASMLIAATHLDITKCSLISPTGQLLWEGAR